MTIRNVYLVGVPTSSAFESSQLSEFVNDGVKTLYLIHDIYDKKFNGYNYFAENSFGFKGLVGTIAEDSMHSGKVFYRTDDLFSFPQNIKGTRNRVAQKFIDMLINIADSYPNTRIVFCTYGSPYLYDTYLLRAIELSLKENIGISFKVIDCDYTTDQSIIKFNEVCLVLKSLSGDKSPYYDRSGLFFPSELIDIPEDTYTNKTITQIIDETALSYTGKTPIIAWSGGIDSTVIIAAFVKNNIDFFVTVNTSTQNEYPEMYDYVVANYKTILIQDNCDMSHVLNQNIVVTGFPADQLFPDLKVNLPSRLVNFHELISESINIEDVSKYDSILLSPVDDAYLYNNAREMFINRHTDTFGCDRSRGEELYDGYLQPIINKFPINIKHFYQLRFFFKFIFKTSEELDGFFEAKTKCKNKVEAFFHTQDFQRWAITNLDKNFEEGSSSYKTYKQPLKQYSYDVLKIDSLLTRLKYPSLNTVTQTAANV